MIRFLAGVAVGSAVIATVVGIRNAIEEAMAILDDDATWALVEDEPVA